MAEKQYPNPRYYYGERLPPLETKEQQNEFLKQMGWEWDGFMVGWRKRYRDGECGSDRNRAQALVEAIADYLQVDAIVRYV